ncbi:MAG: Pyrimidine dimer glycosylase [Rickettsiales bacterium]|jgi:hypothetical protein|nr:Pyrimidine dimer glycosylase [Rickettsiales bacterium]
MRLWSLHPQYLDAKGIVALWRETLLAQKVLDGRTKGYTNHPQLLRFKQHPDPLGAVALYLSYVHTESLARGYNFDQSKIIAPPTGHLISVTSEQMAYERKHLLEKLGTRCTTTFQRVHATAAFTPHPLFHVVQGPVEAWEIV